MSANETTDPISQRFIAATNVLKDLNGWLERKGAEPPQCVIERAAFHVMYPQEYYAWWKTFGFLDPRQETETHAMEDAAIQKVQPNWQRNASS